MSEKLTKEDPKKLAADLAAAGARQFSINQEAEEIVRQLEEYDARDPRAIAAEMEAKRFRLQTLKLKSDIEKLSVEPEFRRFCWRLLEMAGIFRASYHPGDQYETAKNEGRRGMGLDLLSILEQINPNLFVQMRREHVSDKKSQEMNEAARSR